MKHLIFLAMAITTVLSTSPRLHAEILIGDGHGNMVKFEVPETAFTRFQKTFSFEEFQKMDDTDRSYAMPEALIASMNPNAKLTPYQQTNLKHVMSVYYDTMPANRKEEIQRKVMWMAVIIGDSALTKKFADEFFPPYSEERAKKICGLIQDSTVMIAPDAENANFQTFTQLGPNTVAAVAALMDAEKQLGDEKCKIGKNDSRPLSLKEMRTEMARLYPKAAPIVLQLSNNTPPPVWECNSKAVTQIFGDAMSSIERNGPKHKVYIGHGTMKCPVYGLVMRDSKATYRYYRNTFREDAIPTLRFKTAAEVAQLFQPGAATSPSGRPASAAPVSR